MLPGHRPRGCGPLLAEAAIPCSLCRLTVVLQDGRWDRGLPCLQRPSWEGASEAPEAQSFPWRQAQPLGGAAGKATVAKAAGGGSQRFSFVIPETFPLLQAHCQGLAAARLNLLCMRHLQENRTLAEFYAEVEPILAKAGAAGINPAGAVPFSYEVANKDHGVKVVAENKCLKEMARATADEQLARSALDKAVERSTAAAAALAAAKQGRLDALKALQSAYEQFGGPSLPAVGKAASETASAAPPAAAAQPWGMWLPPTLSDIDMVTDLPVPDDDLDEEEKQAAGAALQAAGAAQAALLEARKEAQTQFLAATKAAERAALQRSVAAALCSAAKRRNGADSLPAAVVGTGDATMAGTEGTSPIEGLAAAHAISGVFQQAAASGSGPAGLEQAVLQAVSGAAQRLP